MKILLLGADGQVGWELRRSLAPLAEVVALGRHGEGELCGDLSAPDRLVATVRRLRPAVVVNAAAYTAVDKAEAEPELAHRVNAEAPGALALVMAELGGWLVHYSSDYVFDGQGDQPRREADATGPLNVYGHSKLAGEQRIRASGCRHLILRTSWVYAARGGNFARTMLRLAAERERLQVVDDQIGAPTGADLLADLSAHMIRRAAADPGVSGTYHACASGTVSWCGYARHVIAWAHAHGVSLRTAADAVDAVPGSAFPTPARRPLNSRLATDKLATTFGLVLPPWQTGVERMLDEVTSTTMAAQR